jgi:tetratricopeptide (TPR) repeat protein
MCSHADTLLRAGRYDESIAEHLRTLAFLDQAGDRIEPHSAAFNRTNVQTSIGQAHTLLENWEKAAEHLTTAVGLARARANPGLESRALIHLGEALLGGGHREQAREVYTQCVGLGSTANPQHLATARDRLAELAQR